MRRAFALSNRNLTFPPASRRIVPTVMRRASLQDELAGMPVAFALSGRNLVISPASSRITILHPAPSHYLRRLLACCSISSDAVMALELSS